jgi:hypothetical protein
MKLTTTTTAPAPALLLSFLLASKMMEPIVSKKYEDSLPLRRRLDDGPCRKLKSSKSSKSGDCGNNNAAKCLASTFTFFTDITEHGACIGDTGSCLNIVNSAVGENSCNGPAACLALTESVVGNNACRGEESCAFTSYTEICDSSCDGDGGDYACYGINLGFVPTKPLKIRSLSCIGSRSCSGIFEVQEIGSGSCNGIQACLAMNGIANNDPIKVGKRSCNGLSACYNYSGQSIGDDACIDNSPNPSTTGICSGCNVTVGDGQCNEVEGTTAPGYQ